MNVTDIKSCYIGPLISPEQFVAEHFFLYLAKGSMKGYDGDQNAALKPGEYCIVRKNRLVRYHKQKDEDQFEKVVLIFDTSFLKAFQAKHQIKPAKFLATAAFLRLTKNELVPNFIRSLMPYYHGVAQLDETFADLKREELLLILLRSQPELAGLFFDFGIPEKIDLEAFMTRNFRFNVSIARFAFLTGRSLSAFKRDFMQIFSQTPNRWLVKKRLQEAHFLIEKKKEKPSDIYLQLGFEDLSHFSFAFKKEFGVAPSQLSHSS